MRRRRTSLICSVLAGALALAACGSTSDEGGGAATDGPSTSGSTAALTIAASFYPLQEVLEKVGGQAVHVVDLTPPGREPHELELTGRQLAALHKADAVAYLGAGFQPSVEKSIESLPARVRRIDLLQGIDLLPITNAIGATGKGDDESLDGDKDPHVWLDPENMVVMTDRVANALAELDPAGAATFRANADAYRTQLAALDAEMKAGLADCAATTIVTGHRAFAYLARAVGLTQVPLAGLSPDEEPSAKSLEKITSYAEHHDVKTIFVEHGTSKELSATVAGEVGARTAELDPVESITKRARAKGADYLSIQRDNLAALRKGLECR
jgi:zinc transport system substrate-binding protein